VPKNEDESTHCVSYVVFCPEKPLKYWQKSERRNSERLTYSQRDFHSETMIAFMNFVFDMKQIADPK
jgi:hypothetical protein